jgi:hypothetical protein
MGRFWWLIFLVFFQFRLPAQSFTSDFGSTPFYNDGSGPCEWQDNTSGKKVGAFLTYPSSYSVDEAQNDYRCHGHCGKPSNSTWSGFSGCCQAATKALVIDQDVMMLECECIDYP